MDVGEVRHVLFGFPFRMSYFYGSAPPIFSLMLLLLMLMMVLMPLLISSQTPKESNR